jgi:hypothetical protein
VFSHVKSVEGTQNLSYQPINKSVGRFEIVTSKDKIPNIISSVLKLIQSHIPSGELDIIPEVYALEPLPVEGVGQGSNHN